MGDLEALQRGEPQLVDTHTLPPGPEADALLASGVHMYMVVPMLAGGELIGAISFGGDAGPFPPEQISIAQEAAMQLAIAIVQARLNARLKRQAEELELQVSERTREIETRKLAESALSRHAEELKRSNAELEKFAYVASHDLQEPLRMIGGFAELIKKRYYDKLDADAREFIDYVVDGAARMRQLVDDLLVFSRVGTRGGDFVETPLQDGLDNALKNLRMAIGESGARITHDTLPQVVADRAQLVQLFQNLVGNAIKFRGTDAPCIHVGAEAHDHEWIVMVRDNGIGMEPQYADRVFEIFQRLHSVGQYPGTGVGLAICKKIVERHHGRIWVESELGRGATFCFALPRR
jgi:light-regulated signal transduction histidine kinase (bacteriophytochrome)